jgi:hypothetical protein
MVIQCYTEYTHREGDRREWDSCHNHFGSYYVLKCVQRNTYLVQVSYRITKIKKCGGRPESRKKRVSC